MTSDNVIPAVVPEIDVTDPKVLNDPFSAYTTARETLALARLLIPGFQMWAVTRHEQARSMLGDDRFEINANSFMRPPGIPEHCLPYLRTMSEMDGPEHKRLRRLVTPAFTPRRAAELRPRMERVVDRLLDDLAQQGSPADLLEHFARPLPMDVICELVGVPEADRPQWRTHGAIVAAGISTEFFAAIPTIIDGAKAAVARSRAEPADDLLSDLIRAQDEDGDRLGDEELVTLVWHLVLAGQTPTNLITNAMAELFEHPLQLAELRAELSLMPGAVEELTRLCTPQLLTTPRFAREDVEIDGVLIRKGEAVTASMVSANRDPRAFAEPDRLDIRRSTNSAGHLSFSHGPHFCLGASLSRVQVDVALTGLLRRFPAMELAVAPSELQRTPDGGTWRLASLPVNL
jgi:cytochrome P450